MTKENVIIVEESSYKALLFRKTRLMKWAETGVFVLGLGLLVQVYHWQSIQFKLLAVLIAVAVIGLAPFIYRLVLRPKYRLTPYHLYMEMKGKEEQIPLAQLQYSKRELRFTYTYQNRKINLMVSDTFLERLNEELEKFQKRG